MYENQTNQSFTKHTVGMPHWPRRIAGALSILPILGFSQLALAIPPTFSIIGPEEFNLPLAEPGKGIGFFIQDTDYTFDTQFFDDDGGSVGADPLGHSILSVTRFGRLFSLDATPKVTYYWEYLQPAAYIQAGNNSTTGLADPLVSFTAYFRPTANLLLGNENFLQLPLGNDNLTTGGFQFFPQLIGDYTIGPFGVDGLIGAGFKTDARLNGDRINRGNDYYADLRFRYETSHITPFLTYDFTTTESGDFAEVGAASAAAGTVVGTTVPNTNQNNVGAGLFFYLTKDHLGAFSVWYSYGIAGKNAVRTNGIFTKIGFAFP